MHANLGECTTLCSDDTSLFEGAIEQLEVWLLEETLCWPFWIRGIGDNDIELIFIVIQKLETITNVDFDLRVLVADGHSRKVFLGKANNSLSVNKSQSDLGRIEFWDTDLVNVAQNCLFHAVMLDNLAQHAAIAPANYQHFLGVWVRIHCQVSDHLLVRKFIPLCALDYVVKNKHSSVVGGFKYQNILILALLMVKNALDLESHGLARPHIRNFAKPSICRV